MKIGIVGTGYVGLVSSVMLANQNIDVTSIDRSEFIVNKLKNGESTIYEKDLDKYLKRALKNNKLNFSTNYEEIKNSEAVFICVGTPSCEDGSANLEYVYSAIDSVIAVTDEKCLIIIKSTVPPSSSRHFQKYIHDKGYKHEVANNPEFLREGSAVYDFENPDRIIAGIQSDLAKEIFLKIYSFEISKHTDILFTDLTTSEMIKYVSNSFLSIKLSFINEMANLCEKLDANIHDLSKGVGMDKRIGSLFLKAGPGYGGSCFPKDTNALKFISDKMNVKSDVLSASIKSNLERYSLMAEKISSNAKGKKLAILGMAFKAGTDDIRESPAVEIIKILSKNGFEINCFDPVANNNFEKLKIKNTYISNNIEEAIDGANSIVILTEWEEFKNIDFTKISNKKNIIDLRNILDREFLKSLGFEIINVGIASESK